MRAFSAVALREIVERRAVLAAALAAACVPFLVPLLPGVPGDQAETARSVTALVLSCALGLGGSLLVGASVVGRELAERRLSFHFSRPVSSFAIWSGKLAGGLALVLLAELIVFLPASVASGDFPGIVDRDSTMAIWAILFLAVPLFLLAWIGSVALRSRSPWLVVDLVFLVSLPAALFAIGRRFLRYGGEPGPEAVGTAVGVVLAALAAATFAQVFVGRTDARRGHGAQSIALWSTLLAATTAGALWAERTIDPGVGRLVRAWAEPAGAGGDWVNVQGSAREDGRGSTTYLLNLKSGRSLLMPLGWVAAVSSDGSRAAFVQESPFSSKTLDLGAIDLRTGEAVTLDFADWPDGVDLTADGRRLAVVSGSLCRVVELPSLRLLTSARVPVSGWAYAPRFVSPDTVRLFPSRWRRGAAGSTSSPRVLPDPEAKELHVTARAVTNLAPYPVSSIPLRAHDKNSVDPGPVFVLVPGPDLSRVLVVGFGSAPGVRLLDASSGRILASVDGPGTGAGPMGTFLADGRVVVAEPTAEGRRLVLFSREGTRLSEIPLPGDMSRVRFGTEPGRGLLSIGVDRKGGPEKWEWYVANLEDRSLRPLESEGLQRPWWSAELRFPPSGSPASRLAHDGDGRLVLFDPATGTTKPLTRGRPAGK